MSTRLGIAESVAADLRSRILSGELADGTVLPRYDDLVEQFVVSRPTLREAMRILESQGLISVLRGAQGGAVVHSPRDRNIAYTLGLVLEAGQVGLDDVAVALEQMEPMCARLCAARPDRAEAVVPALQRVHDEALRAVETDDFTAVARRFHEELVSACGNDTLKVMAGALVALWSAHEREWAHHGGPGVPTSDQRRAGLRAHERLIGLIGDGRSEEAAAFATQHIQESQRAALKRTSQRRVTAAAVQAELAVDRAKRGAPRRSAEGGGRG